MEKQTDMDETSGTEIDIKGCDMLCHDINIKDDASKVIWKIPGTEVHRRQLSTRRHLEQVKRELSSWSPKWNGEVPGYGKKRTTGNPGFTIELPWKLPIKTHSELHS